jgi:hypothetical protein
MRYEHEIVFGNVELVRIEGERIYVVDREREELRSLDWSHRDFKLTQRQFGRLEDGGVEILERYALDDVSESIVLDSSPSQLEDLEDKATGRYWAVR